MFVESMLPYTVEFLNAKFAQRTAWKSLTASGTSVRANGFFELLNCDVFKPKVKVNKNQPYYPVPYNY